MSDSRESKMLGVYLLVVAVVTAIVLLFASSHARQTVAPIFDTREPWEH